MKAIIALIAFFFFLHFASPSFAVNLLSNPGFEDGTTNWAKYGGTLGTSSSIINNGTASATLTSTTQSTKWVYQVVSVTGGIYYSFSGYAVKNDNNISSILLRVSWYSSTDGGGSELSHNDSTTSLTDNNSAYQSLSTESIIAPDDASSSRVKVVVAFSSTSQAIAYFDDFVFQETSAPTSTPTPTSSPTPTATPTQTPTPTRTPTPTPTPTPTLKPSPTKELLPTDILGESTESGLFISPTNIANKKNVLVANKSKSQDTNLQKLLMFLGVVVFIAACGIVTFRVLKSRLNKDEQG